MLRDFKDSVRHLWQDDPAELTQRVINMTLSIGTAALIVVASVNIAVELGGFAI